MRTIRLIFLFSVFICSSFSLIAADIPARQIKKLEEQLVDADLLATTASVRRACKRVIRNAESLLKRHPDADSRYRVLGLVFKARQVLYVQKQSEEHTEALIETAKLLTKAPDKHAAARIDADMLLVQIALSQTEGAGKQALVVAKFADRYRGTPAEARSLMMSATLAFNLGHRTLLENFRFALSQKFGQNAEVSAFLKERFATSKPIVVTGVFRRRDGTEISFPKGQRHVLCFWSREAEDLDKKIAEVTALQQRYKGQVTVYSFNLDELGDCGARVLAEKKLDWIAMRLKGGEDNPAFVSIGTKKLFASLVINPFGYAEYWQSQGGGHNRRGGAIRPLLSRYESAQETASFLAFWRSLLTGDFFAHDLAVPEKSGIPAATTDAMKTCFVPAFLRHRLTLAQELSNYRKAEALCADAGKKHAASPGLPYLQNCRIVALMGIWRGTGDVASLNKATGIAKTLVAGKGPLPATLVSHYCLAVANLQREGIRPHDVLASFIKSTGGDKASATAQVAAVLLALEGHLPDQYARYRNSLLSRHCDNPAVSWFTSFILDPRIENRAFKRALPDNGRKVISPPLFKRTFTAELTTVDGKKVVLPEKAADRIIAVAFLEKPASDAARKQQDHVMDYLAKVANSRPLKDMGLVAIFRAGDAESVKKRMTAKKWTFDAAALPDTAWGPLCRQYGVLSADNAPSIFLIRPNGAVAGALTDLNISTRVPLSSYLNREVEPLLRAVDLPLIEDAMASGNYKLAVSRLQTSVPLDYRRRSRHEPNWLTPNQHRRKLVWCLMQMEDWKKALAEINKIIDARLTHTNYIKGHIKARKWCRLCHGHLPSFITRILILKKLGRAKEANEMMAMFKPYECPLVKDINVLWKSVEDGWNGFQKDRPGRYGSHERHLGHLERRSRNKQFLYSFDMETDLVTRSQILAKLGKKKEGAADMANARLHAWPYEPRGYDIRYTREAAQKRRVQASLALGKEDWQEALKLMDFSVEVHEAGPERCNALCRHCGDQHQALTLRAKALRSAGRNQEAENTKVMADAAKCPVGGKDLLSDWYFPAGRVGWGNVTKSDLGYLDEYLRGGVHAIEKYRRERFEFAQDLRLRSQALAGLGKTEGATRDHQRAKALVYLSGPSWHRPRSQQTRITTLPKRYVDLLEDEPKK